MNDPSDKGEFTKTVLLLNKAIRQIADSAGVGACCGVDVGGEVSHTAKTIIARYDKLTEQNKMLREALEVLREATEHLIDDSLVLFMGDGRQLNLDMLYDLVDKALEEKQ